MGGFPFAPTYGHGEARGLSKGICDCKARPLVSLLCAAPEHKHKRNQVNKRMKMKPRCSVGGLASNTQRGLYVVSAIALYASLSVDERKHLYLNLL